MATVTEMFQQVLGRSPLQGGLDYYTNIFGSDVSAEELAAFQRDPAALAELARTGYTAPTPQPATASRTPAPAGTAYAEGTGSGDVVPSAYQPWANAQGATPTASLPANVGAMFQQVLGRPALQGGLDYYTNLFGNTIEQDEYDAFLRDPAALAELARTGYVQPTGAQQTAAPVTPTVAALNAAATAYHTAANMQSSDSNAKAQAVLQAGNALTAAIQANGGFAGADPGANPQLASQHWTSIGGDTGAFEAEMNQAWATHLSNESSDANIGGMLGGLAGYALAPFTGGLSLAASTALGAGGGTLVGGGSATDALTNAALGYGGATLAGGLTGGAAAAGATPGATGMAGFTAEQLAAPVMSAAYTAPTLAPALTAAQAATAAGQMGNYITAGGNSVGNIAGGGNAVTQLPNGSFVNSATGTTTTGGTGGTTASTTGGGGGTTTPFNWSDPATYPWGNIASTGATMLGGYLTAEQAADAAQTSANAQIEAARIAAEASRFRPVGVTTRFGGSQFGYDAAGNLTSAGYQLSPEARAQQDALMGVSGQMLTQYQGAPAATAPMGTAAQTMFNLGQGYLQTSPQAQAAQYMSEQQALLAPSRERDLAQLQSQMQAQGRGGFAIGGTSTGMMAANPQLEALYNAQRQQDLQLASQATQGGQQYAQFGAGMVGSGGDMLQGMYGTQTAAYAPYQTALGGATTLEALGQQPMDIGTAIGAKTSTAAAQAGMLQAQGVQNAAQTMQPANAYSPWGAMLSGAGNTIANYQTQQQQQQQQQFQTNLINQLITGRV